MRCKLIFKAAFLIILLMLSSNMHLNSQSVTGNASNPPDIRRASFTQLISFAKAHYTTNASAALPYAIRAWTIADSIGNEQAKTYTLDLLGDIYAEQLLYSQSLTYYNQALELKSKQTYNAPIADSYRRIGIVYFRQSDYDKALYYFYQALRREQIASKDSISVATLTSLGQVYKELDQTDQAVAYYYKALAKEEKAGNRAGIALQLNHIATIYLHKGKFPLALTRLQESIQLQDTLQRTIDLAITYRNLGLVYYKLQSLDQSVYYLNRAAQIQREQGADKEEAATLRALGEVYSATEEFTLAVDCLTQAQILAQRTHSLVIQLECYQLLAGAYEKLEKPELAVAAYQSLLILKDSVHNQATTDKVAELQVKYATKEKEKELEQYKLLNDIKELKIRKNRIILYFVVSCALLILVLLLLSFNRYRIKHKMNLKLSLQNEEITRQNLDIAVQKNKIERNNYQLQIAQKIIRKKNTELKRINADLEGRVKENTDELRETYVQLMNRDKEFDNFMYRTSHDLRGPLTTLLGLCQLALNEVKDSATVSYLEMIIDTVSRMDLLLWKLLRINEIKNLIVSYEPVDLQNLILTRIQFLRKHENLTDVDVQVYIDSHLDFYSCQPLIEIILENLLINAIHHRKMRESAQSFIRITVNSTAEQVVVIRVSDNGDSIPSMYADKIFDMFFRTTANPNQTGLGLYVVKVAVEKLNGNIVLKESPAGLTTFEVKLPYPKPTSPEVLTLQVQKRLAGTTELRDL